MIFSVPWTTNPAFGSEPLPLLTVFLRCNNGMLSDFPFLVDSGADLSLAPRDAADDLGLEWEQGDFITLRGLSQKEECAVSGRIHYIEVHILEAQATTEIPVCFADGATPFIRPRRILRTFPDYI
jgi:hypothetical protein